MDPKIRDENIELYGRGFDLLMAALAEVPQEAMNFKPEPKEWSVHEILIHLADSEAIAAQQDSDRNSSDLSWRRCSRSHRCPLPIPSLPA